MKTNEKYATQYKCKCMHVILHVHSLSCTPISSRPRIVAAHMHEHN